jgi:EpsI family protein
MTMSDRVFVKVLVVSACLLSGAVVIARASQSEIVPTRVPLSEMPLRLGEWQGRTLPDFPQAILDVLGVDEYISRLYSTAAAHAPVSLYVGYYQSQRQGETMHSPLNCLPGAGWIPIVQRRIHVPVRDQHAAREIEVNSFVIEKGLDRQAVIYWYQSHGRVVPSEYWGRIYMVLDAIRSNRTDGALVRIIVPIGRDAAAGAAAAEQTAVEFVQELFPVLSGYLPV